MIPFTELDLAFWRTQIKDARQVRDDVAEMYGWDENLKRYVPKPTKSATGGINADINTGADFRDVERKKAALFYDTPQVSLSVTQDREVAPAAQGRPPLMLSTLVLWHQELLNTLLGPQHANVKPTVLKAIFDCLCPAGVGPVTVGYQATMRTELRTVPLMDPTTGQPVMQPVPAIEQVGASLGLLPPPMPQPIMQQVEVEIPIYERWFVSRFSPKALLIPSNFRDTDFSRAPWLGRDWRKPLSQVKREYQLPAEWTASAADDETKPYFENVRLNTNPDDAGDPFVSGVELSYRAALRSEDEIHPEAMRQLVLVDGKDEPLIHRESPHQDFGETGEMAPGSLRGFVDRPLVLRDLSDSAWIPSDSAVTAALTRELERFREQIIDQRNGNKQVIAFDSDKFDPTVTDKIKKSHGVTWVPVAAGALMQGKDAVMVQVAQPTLGRESYLGQDIIERDREQILGIGSNQAGVQSKGGSRTATENTIVQRNSEARFEQERQRVLEWFLDVVGAFDTLVLRYADARIGMQILGEVRGQMWADNQAALVGGYSYTLQVDSGKYLDAEADRRQAMQEYNQLRKDPFVNPRVLLKGLAEKFGHDPAEFIVEPPRPDKELKTAFSFKGEDFNPMNPGFAIYVKIARQSGWEITDEDVRLAQQQASQMGQGLIPVSGVGSDPRAPQPPPEHPGAQEKAPTINQHQADESGDRTGPKVDTGGGL